MLDLLLLLRAWAISRDACVAAFRESLVSRCHKQSTRIRFRAVITSQVSPAPPCQCDPWAACRLMTPNHPQATPISQPRSSLADQSHRIPSVCNTFSLPSLFIFYLLHDLASEEFKLSSMDSSEQHFEKGLHWFCSWVTTTNSGQGWEEKPELLTQQPGTTITHVSLAMRTGEKDAAAQSRSLPVCAMGL